MLKKEKQYITYDQFIDLFNRSKTMSCEEIIQTHKELIGKKDSSKICDEEFGLYYVKRLLDYNYGYSVVKEMPTQVIEFFNSKYFSDYLKTIINSCGMYKPDSISDIVNSNRNLTELNEDELLDIHKFLKENGHYNLVINLAFNLNSREAIQFLNNRIDPITVISRIIATSGLSPRPEYYSGRGTRLGDLNGIHLKAIFNQLLKLHPMKAANMAQMALNMATLGATEFLESLYMLAYNNYSLVGIEPSKNNISFGKTTGKAREVIALGSWISIQDNRPDVTEEIKTQFASLLPNEILSQVGYSSAEIAHIKRNKL